MSQNRYRRPPKFTPGEVITSAAQLRQFVAEGRWIFFMPSTTRLGKPRVYAGAWIANMLFACVMSYIERGLLRVAVRNPEAPYVFKAKFMESHVPDVCSEWWVTCSEIPDLRIRAFTKDVVFSEVADAARRHVGSGPVSVRVEFEVPVKEPPSAPGALLP